MVQSIDQELEIYLSQLNNDQKQSLLDVIKSFLPQKKVESKYTPEELALFYERREEYLKNMSSTYTVEESHNRIRQNRAGK